MTNNKYELTNNKKEWLGHTLFQIKALVNIEKFNISKGELGGYIEKEENLDQSDNAWVYGDARVYGNAWVSGNARVYGKLKLLTGWFFGVRYEKEEIKYIKIDEDNELIYKGEAKFGEDEVKSLSGKTVKVEIDGVGYEAIIK